MTRLADLLDAHHPTDATEAADLQRARDLVAAGDDPWARDTPLHLTASALIVHPPSGRVLLRWHRRQQAWLQVGGHAEPGETDPLDVALREAHEESGLTDLVPWPDARLVQIAVVPVAPRADEPAHEHADLRFVLTTAIPDAVRPEDEHARLRWLPLDEARELTEPNVREGLGRLATLISC